MQTGNGRPASIQAARMHEMKVQETGATEIAKALGVHRASVCRLPKRPRRMMRRQ
jgi:hypothetical protein